MASEISTALKFFSQSPGHLVYHLILCLALLFGLVWAIFKSNRSGKQKLAKALLIGTCILFLLQSALFIISILNSADIYQSSLTFALVDRLITGLTIIGLVWVLQDDNRPMILNWVLIFVSLMLILISSAAVLFNHWQPDLLANALQIYDITWQITILLIALGSIIAILIMKPKQWIAGLVLLLLVSMGQIFQIMIASTGENHMGAIRLALILSMPVFVVFVIKRLKHKDQITKSLIAQKQKEGLPSDTKADLINLLLTLPLEATPQARIKTVVQAISLSVIADVCYLIRFLDSPDDIEILVGYDLIQERFLPTSTISPGSLPSITSSWKDHQVLQRSQAQLEDRDYETLTKLLNYFRTGYVLAIPLAIKNELASGGIIFLSPYTSKNWGQSTLDLISTIKDNLARVLFSPSPWEVYNTELEEIRTEKQKLISEKGILAQLLANKEITIDHQAKHLQELQGKHKEESDEVNETIHALQQHVEALTNQKNTSPDSGALEQLQEKIRQIKGENDQLQVLLSRANARIKDLEVQSGQTGPIRLSTQNQILSLDSVAANVKLEINPQLQQRHIKLEIINPDGRQMIKTDPELLQKTVYGLLENAIKVSEPGSAVQLNQHLSFETGMLILEVTDFGDGLTPEEQKAFFSADVTNIPGIGSTSAIRDAIRAIRVLNGKIWLRSKKWNFTTFRVQLPVRIID